MHIERKCRRMAFLVLFCLSTTIYSAGAMEFLLEQEVNTGSGTSEISAGDFNGDGFIDIACSIFGSSDVVVFNGNGSGRFDGPGKKYPIRAGGYMLLNGDLDGDGDLDLVVGTNTKPIGSIQILLNNGHGEFSTGSHYESGIQAFQAALADLDKDGDLDLVTTDPSHVEWALSIRYNDGLANFDQYQNLLSEESVTSDLGVTDFDQDGHVDILVGLREGGISQFLYGLPNGNFVESQILDLSNTNSEWSEYAVADFSGDGKTDVIVANYFDREIELLVQGNDRIFNASARTSGLIGAIQPRASDLDNDGDFDVVALAVNSSEILVFENKGDGLLTTEPLRIETEDSPRFLTVADLDHDGYDDLLISHLGDQKSYVWLNQGSKPAVSGRVYTEFSGDCEDVEQEYALAHKVIEIQPGPHYTISDSKGEYIKRLPPGEYTLNVAHEALWFTECGLDQRSVTLSGESEVFGGIDFPRNANSLVQDLRVSIVGSRMRPGLQGDIIIEYVNAGTLPYTGTLEFTFDERYEIVSYSREPSRAYTGAAEWDLESLPIGFRGKIFVRVRVPRSVQRGEVLCAQAQASVKREVELLNDHRDEFCVEVTGGYDPNDIRVTPKGQGDAGVLASDVRDLAYMIRFQNDGNDTTFNVTIRDTLSAFYDTRSLRFGASSHDYTVTLLDNNILEFYFEDVLLPPSEENLLGSQGFVKYEILLAEDLAVGTHIRNRAGIFFDFNDVVLTNYAVTTVGGAATSVDEDPAGLHLAIQPNPAIESLTISNRDAGCEFVTLLDIHGRELGRFASEGRTTFSLDCSELAPGTYFVQTVGSLHPRSARFVVGR